LLALKNYIKIFFTFVCIFNNIFSSNDGIEKSEINFNDKIRPLLKRGFIAIGLASMFSTFIAPSFFKNYNHKISFNMKALLSVFFQKSLVLFHIN